MFSADQMNAHVTAAVLAERSKPREVRMLTVEEIYCAWDEAGNPIGIRLFTQLIRAAAEALCKVNSLTIKEPTQ